MQKLILSATKWSPKFKKKKFEIFLEFLEFLEFWGADLRAPLVRAVAPPLRARGAAASPRQRRGGSATRRAFTGTVGGGGSMSAPA